MLGDGAGVLNTKIDDVEVFESELAYVLFDLAAQLLRCGSGHLLAPRITTRPDLGGNDQILRVRGERSIDRFVGRSQRSEVEGGGVDVIDAKLDGAAKHGDRLVAIVRGAPANAGLLVRRIAPHPMRFTVKSPSSQEPAAAAGSASVFITKAFR